MRILLKLIVRIYLFVINNGKILFYKRLFGKQFTSGKFYARSGFSLIIAKNANIKIGNNVFMNHNCSINALERIEIGDNCIFGEDVKIYDHNHKFSDLSSPIVDQGFKKRAVIIGNNCWVGSNVIILQGVSIGDNVVIGANCLVYKNVPDNTLVKQQQNLILESRI